MKKRVLLFCLMAMIFGSTLFCQNFELKLYSDYYQDFSGASAAMFLGEITPEIQSELDKKMDLISEHLKEVKKLTKNNNWLLKKAMNEWEYQQGEFYIAFLAESRYSKNGIIVFVQIDNTNNYVWRAWTISEKDIDVLSKVFEDF